MADFKWKIRLSTLKLRRIDEVEEDDFKTWALTTVATSGGVAAGLWYSSSDGQASAAGDPNANLGKTSVTNGLEAAYNFARGSPKIELSEATAGALADSSLTIAVYRGDKRSSVEDTLLGKVLIPLKFLLNGKEVNEVYQLIPAPTGPKSSDAYVGTLDVHVSADAALEVFCRGGRVLKVGGVSVLPPSAWIPEASADATNEQLVALSKDVSQPANSFRYCLDVKVGPSVVSIPGGRLKLVNPDSVSGDIPDAKLTEDAAGDEPATQTKYQWRINWEKESSIFLATSSVASLIESIESGIAIAAVLKRIATVPSDSNPSVLEETDEEFLSRGQVSISLEDLLAPGNAVCEGEFNVTPAEVTEEDKAAALAEREAREAAKAKAGGKPGGKPAAKPAPPKGGKAAPAAEATPEVNVHQTGGSVLCVSIVLDEPLRLRPPSPPTPVLTPSDLIAPRTPAPKVPFSLPASSQFREDVALVVHSIAEQYIKISREVITASTASLATGPQDIDAKRKALMTALNNSGQYYAMKERLKRSAVRIVRERFHKTELQTEAEYVAAKDAFLSELYTYLIGQANRAMHDAFTEAVALSTGAVSSAEASRAASVKGSVISLILQAASRPDGRLPSESKEGRDETEAELDRLGRIAQESEHTGDVKKAGLCLQTRVAKAEKAASQGLSPNGYNPEPWYSYGMFNLRQSDFAKANECFREAIAIDAKHIPSLQALGSLSSQLGDGNTATTLLTAALQLATPQSPSAALINILLAVVAERSGDVVFSAASISASVSALRATGSALIKPVVGDTTLDTVIAPAEPYLLAASFLLEANLLELAEIALIRAAACISEQDVPKDVRISLLIGESKLLSARGPSQYSSADARLTTALEYDRANKGAWKAKAQLNLAQIDAGTGGVTLADAKSAFEFAVGDWSVDCTDVQLLLQLGQTYLDSGDESLFKSAKEVFLRAAKVCDWAIAWLGAGQAAYLSGSLDQAEAALNQANIRDNTNADVWAWLSLVCMETEPPREKEGMQALDQALVLGLNIAASADLLTDLASAFSSSGKEQVTERILDRVLGATGDLHVKLCLAESYARQSKLDDAIPLFKEIISSGVPDVVKAAASGLATVTEQLGDVKEAARIRSQYRV